jgi:lipopolysaccharide transport system permease protein
MFPSLRELYTSRELLVALASREIRARYKQSVMGFLWAILMPVIITGAGLTVRIVAAQLSGHPVTPADIGGIGIKALPWAFFVSALRFGTNSLASNSNMVTKIKFPRLVFPLSSVLSSFADMIVATPLLLVLLPFAGARITPELLWVPLLMALLVLFTAGLAVLCSAANLFFRDVKYLVEVVLTFAIFFTPVLYNSSMAGRYQPVLLLNPVADFLEGLNDVVMLGRHPDLGWLAYATLVTLILCWTALSIFRRLEPRFAESV